MSHPITTESVAAMERGPRGTKRRSMSVDLGCLRITCEEREAALARIEGLEQALGQACNILDESTNPSIRIAALSMRGFLGRSR